MPDRSTGIVVVTGASAGVGRATAVAFARRGWNVALLARGADGLEGAAREVQAAGGGALVLSVDVADPDAVFAAAERVIAAWGRIDVWVNNAMATVFAPLAETSPEEFRRVTEVTYLGYVHGTMAALRHMRPRDAGTVVQVGSALSYRAIPLQAAYCGAKFAIRGFTDALRSELLRDRSRVRVTMVQLPAVNTPQFDWARSRLPGWPQPVPPVHQPEAVAEAVFRAAGAAPRELWVGVPTLKATLGTTALPGLLYRLLARRGYEGQMTLEAAPPGRPDNLFAPVAGDHCAHGRFDARARSRVLSVDPAALRTAGLAAAALGLAAAATGLARLGQGGRRRLR